MKAVDPESARHIIADYVAAFERHTDLGAFPACADDLPHPKQTIKAAIGTSLALLARTGQLTDELRHFLEEAYVSLSDYAGTDLVQRMPYPRAAADEAELLRIEFHGLLVEQAGIRRQTPDAPPTRTSAS